MATKKLTKESKVLKHIAKTFWNVGLILMGVAMLTFVIDLTHFTIGGDVYSMYNTVAGNVTVVLSIGGFFLLFIAFCFRVAILFGKSTSKLLWELSMLLYALCFVTLNFSIGGLNTLVGEPASKGAAFFTIILACAAVVISVIGFIVWCIFRFKKSNFAKVHDFVPTPEKPTPTTVHS